MSDENFTNRLTEDDGSIAGDVLLQALRRDMQGLFGLIKALDEKVDARLNYAVPMLEGVVSRLDAIVTEQESQGARLDAIEVTLERLDVIEGEIRQLRRRIERMILELSHDGVEVRAAQHDFEDRLEKLEKTPV